MSDDVDEKESIARANLPYRVELCKTSRAKCKRCLEIMQANSVKIAYMTKSRFHDGYDASYCHPKCFFQIKRPTSVAEIRYFENLSYDDQKIIETAIETNGRSLLGASVSVEETKKDLKTKSKKRSKGEPETALVNYDDFMVEYAKSSRSTCVSCSEKIEKETVRLGKKEFGAENQWGGGPIPRWYHVDCFIKSIEQLEFFGKVSKIPDFDLLEDDDQKMLRKKFKHVKADIKPEVSKKPKVEDPEALKEERLLKEQSDALFKLRAFVEKMKRKDIEQMLESMGQKSNYKYGTRLVDMATDILLFGLIGPCPNCKHSRGMELKGDRYICTSGSDVDPCNFETRAPKREPPYDIPEEIIGLYPFFQEEYTFEPRQRIFPSKFVKAVEQKEAEDNNLVTASAPLDGLSIGVISWKTHSIDKVKLEKKVKMLGGKIQTALDKSVFVIVSNEKELASESPKVEVAKALEVPFAKPDFLLKIESKDDVIPQISKCLIGDWQGDIEARFDAMRSAVKAETA